MTKFNDFLEERLKDEEFKSAWEELQSNLEFLDAITDRENKYAVQQEDNKML